jgi:hypothetical protein
METELTVIHSPADWFAGFWHRRWNASATCIIDEECSVSGTAFVLSQREGVAWRVHMSVDTSWHDERR